jgi:hypothetical protein
VPAQVSLISTKMVQIDKFFVSGLICTLSEASLRLHSNKGTVGLPPYPDGRVALALDGGSRSAMSEVPTVVQSRHFVPACWLSVSICK